MRTLKRIALLVAIALFVASPGYAGNRCKDGKAIEHWGVTDAASLMAQLQTPAKTEE